MGRRSKTKRGQKRKPAHIRFQRQLDEGERVALDRIGTGDSVMPSLPNANDNIAIQQLYRNPLGQLPLDLHAPDAVESLAEFRLALINVYYKAAEARYLGKPTKAQLTKAGAALSQLNSAILKLDKVGPVGQRGLHLAVAGSPIDDTLGILEVNQFATTCRKIRMNVAPHALALDNAIKTERASQTRSGERRKRLRTLVEVLADWWRSLGGSLAPTVDASRRDGAPAVVHGRKGDFLQLAVKLFCYVDVFAHTEVEAAVTNVYEGRLKAAQSSSGD